MVNLLLQSYFIKMYVDIFKITNTIPRWKDGWMIISRLKSDASNSVMMKQFHFWF